ncbi:Zn(2)-C6 fungal-type domain-containing protein [Mycena sanguinolenta]|uniref:Zn(2)-C6 fungal-type domain-containing protein n=1 Tax=Mycena sanguinolenta TaxID=230812 RepID=A0A8H6Y3U5_9AGAR|nr:Zn(2)-C6 fungal-type domain-containing protein [Mycena sanguinolenta]
MDQERTSRNSKLGKSKACLNCRRRKVRCDGKKPTCTPCERFIGGGLHDCEYTETGPAQSQVLEEQISIIQSRIRELEQPSEKTSVGLHNPYQSSHRRGSSFDEFAPGPSTSISRTPILQPHSPELFKTLMNTFLRHSSQVGFFLNPKMFDNLSNGAAPSQIACPALLDAVYLWGAHLSRSAAISVHEASLLSNALHSATRGLSSDSCPNAIRQTIQAEMLLAQYFFRNARMLEGKYHASAAVSIVLSSGFHKIRSAERPVGPISPAPNSLNEGESINAFWAVLTLNNTWLAADGSPRDVSSAVVDTPWPLDIHAYSQEPELLPSHSNSTIESFLSNVSDRGTSLVALHAKAAIAFEQASRLARFTENIALQNPETLATEFSNLEKVIVALGRLLPPLEQNGSHSLPLVIHSLVQVAIIQVHNPFVFKHAVSRSRSLTAAMAVVKFVRQTNLSGLEYIDAIVGTLWMAACQVFITELSRPEYGPTGTENHNHAKFHEAVETLLAAMSAFAGDCRMIELQLETAQRNYHAIGNP